MVTSPRQEAPGSLERVRELLNTWLIPNDTREPADTFDDFAEKRGFATAERRELRALRDDLRLAVERPPEADAILTMWIERARLRPVVREGHVTFVAESGPAGSLVATVLSAIIDGMWPRLKACPDCRWVFFDHTRNAGKRWCVMSADGSGARGCGTIAKVRRYRERHPDRQ